jgi:COP9 signalosome complex subunit 12
VYPRTLSSSVSICHFLKLDQLSHVSVLSSISWIASKKGNRIPIIMFHAALNMSGMDMPLEEAECLLANQIYRGFIKGYISHEKQMVVLSNVNAFPRLADRASPFAIL